MFFVIFLHENEKMPDEYLLKICILGIPDKLKTKIIRGFAEGKFTTNYLPTLGVDITTKRIEVQENHVKLIIVDTASQEFFSNSRPSYYRGASACLIFCALDDQTSFEVVPDFLAEFSKHIPQSTVPIALVGIRNTTQNYLTKKRRQKESLEKRISQRKKKQVRKLIWLRKIIKRFQIQVRIKIIKSKKSKKDRVDRTRMNRLERDIKKVSPREAKNLAKELGIDYFEVNEDDPLAIKEVFLQITRESLLKWDNLIN
jgi:GTPase SAR1 family protein